MKEYKDLFDYLSDIGETDSGDYHILEFAEYGDVKLRAYFFLGNDAYCIDVNKQYVCEPEEVSETDEECYEDGYEYYIFAEWDGFTKKTDKELIELIYQIVG